jgi:ribose/xylose/arabinose/galactoside ABC-type transport system permease subunit
MSTANSNWKDKLIVLFLNNKALFILLILVIVATIVSDGLFLTQANLSSVSRQIAVTIVIGLGFTAVLAVGGVDLSAGHMLSFIGVSYAMLSLLLPLPVAIALAILLGVTSGFCNGFITEKFNLPPFILTLAAAQVYRSFAFLLSEGRTVGGLSADLRFIGQGILFQNVFGGIPISIFIAVAVGIVLAIVLYRTKYGRHVIATGGNEKAARVAGINTKRIKISAYMVMGGMVSIAAILLTGRTGMASPAAGEGMEMDAIAAVVIGGTSMAGGKANVGGTIFGCLVIGVIANLLNLMNVSSFWQWFAKGAIIILAIIIDSQSEKIISKLKTKAA